MDASSPFYRHPERFMCFFRVGERKGTEPKVRAPGLVLGDHGLVTVIWASVLSFVRRLMN